MSILSCGGMRGGVGGECGTAIRYWISYNIYQVCINVIENSVSGINYLFELKCINLIPSPIPQGGR